MPCSWGTQSSLTFFTLASFNFSRASLILSAFIWASISSCKHITYKVHSVISVVHYHYMYGIQYTVYMIYQIHSQEAKWKLQHIAMDWWEFQMAVISCQTKLRFMTFVYIISLAHSGHMCKRVGETEGSKLTLKHQTLGWDWTCLLYSAVRLRMR